MLIDSNVSLGRWPFRRVSGDDTQTLVKKLQQAGVSLACAGSFEGLFQRDISDVNQRLADECRQHGAGLLVPFGTVGGRIAATK